MGIRTAFIKATGNCRIKKSLIKELIEKQKQASEHDCYYYTWIIEKLRFLIQETDDDDYISLEQVGEEYNDSSLYYYIDDRKVWDLHLFYQMMSLNGMQCFKSVSSPPVPSKRGDFSSFIKGYGWSDGGHTNFISVQSRKQSPPLNGKVVEGILRSEIEFKSYDELY